MPAIKLPEVKKPAGVTVTVNIEEEAIKKAFATCTDAIIGKNGDTLSNLVDSSTVAYFTKMQQLALKGGQGEVKALPLADRLTVVRLRHAFDKEAMTALTGTKVLMNAVNRGWLEAKALQKAKLEKIVISETQATAEFSVKDQPAPVSVAFVKENNMWHLNLMPIVKMTEPVIQDLLKKSGKAENDFISQFVTQESGKPVRQTIWEPLAV